MYTQIHIYSGEWFSLIPQLILKPIVMKFNKRYFLMMRQLPWKLN